MQVLSMRRHSTPAEQWHKERGKIKERFNIEWLTDEESFPETRPFLLPLPVLSPCNSSVWLCKTPSRIPMVRVNGLPWLRRLILFGPPTHKVRPEPRQGNSWWTAQPDRQTDRRMGRHNLPTQSVAMFVPPPTPSVVALPFDLLCVVNHWLAAVSAGAE